MSLLLLCLSTGVIAVSKKKGVNVNVVYLVNACDFNAKGTASIGVAVQVIPKQQNQL